MSYRDNMVGVDKPRSCTTRWAAAACRNTPTGPFCVNLSCMGLRDEDLLTVAEVAEILHLNTRTVQRWIAAGKLKAVRMPNGRYRIRATDADAMLHDT